MASVNFDILGISELKWMGMGEFNSELPYDSAIPLLSIYPEKTSPERYMHTSVHSSTIYNSQDIETN